MNTHRSSSRVLGFAAALLPLVSLSLGACSARDNDDVFTSDERRSDIGAVARGDVTFPLAMGTAVPNADGDAVPLTDTMVGLRLHFTEMTVKGTCDSDVGGEGEFYYDLGINGRTTVRRPQSRWYSAKESEAIPLDAERVFFVQGDERFLVHLSVWEDDDGLNFKDDSVGTRDIQHSAADLRNGRAWRTVDLGTDECGVSVSYELEYIQ